MLRIIAAVSDNGVIGRGDEIPWRLQADMRRFKQLTLGGFVIVGRNTHESIVKRLGKPLPGRTTIILSRQSGYTAPGCVVVQNLKMAQALCSNDAWIIGGAAVYTAALPLTDKLCLTRVHATVSGDAWFPEWSRSQWQLVFDEHYSADDRNEYPFVFEEYQRKKPKGA